MEGGREGERERAKVEFIKRRIGSSEKERDKEMTSDIDIRICSTLICTQHTVTTRSKEI